MCLFSTQNGYGAASSDGAPQQAQETVTLECSDVVIEHVPKELLVQNFGFFRTYFGARGRGLGSSNDSSAIKVYGTIEDMTYLLSLVSPLYVPLSGKKLPSAGKLRSLVVLADNLLMKGSDLYRLVGELASYTLMEAMIF